MLQVFHAKWHNGLSKGESSKGYDVVVELRGGVASYVATQKTELRSKCLRRVYGSGMKKCGDGVKSRGSGMKQ
jgi:hypothetical protein